MDSPAVHEGKSPAASLPLRIIHQGSKGKGHLHAKLGCNVIVDDEVKPMGKWDDDKPRFDFESHASVKACALWMATEAARIKNEAKVVFSVAGGSKAIHVTCYPVPHRKAMLCDKFERKSLGGTRVIKQHPFTFHGDKQAVVVCKSLEEARDAAHWIRQLIG
jgi:hypothetical protein